MNTDFYNEEEIRIKKMISEGGPILADYFNDPQRMSKERLAAKAMIDEGGIGAEIYYNDNEKVAKIDIEETENEYKS